MVICYKYVLVFWLKEAPTRIGGKTGVLGTDDFGFDSQHKHCL